MPYVSGLSLWPRFHHRPLHGHQQSTREATIDGSRRQFLQQAGAAIAAPALMNHLPHVVLLGDSIFANGAYTHGAPDVAERLRQRMPENARVSLLAADGAVMADIPGQLARLPADTTHLVMSAGGNDALRQQALLRAPATSVSAALDLLADAVASFEAGYGKAVAACLAQQLPLTVCTIYNGHFSDAARRRQVRTALALFDDAILRAATEHRIGAIDLRQVCEQAGDYANETEPSSAGAAKIARAIIAAIAIGTPQHAAFVLGAPA